MRIKKWLLLFTCILISGYSYGQKDMTQYYIEQSKVCGGIDSVLRRTGSWKKESDDLAFPDKTFPKDQYKLVNTRVDAMSDLFKEALPQLSGFEPRWSRGMRGNSYMTNGALPYSLRTSYFGYYCNTNVKKILVGDETGTWAYVFVNHFNWFCSEVDSWDIQGDGKKITIYQLPPKVGKWKDVTVYEPRAHGKLSRAIIIGHDGKVPWFTLSQKQYLTGLKTLLEAKKKQALDHHDSYEEKTKKSTENTLKNSTPEQAEKIKSQQEQNFKANQKGRETTEKFFNEKLQPIDDYLAANSQETLSKAAILDPRAGIEGFKGTFGDEENGGIKLIALAGKYFNKDLPRYAPQFMVLYWRWTEHPSSLGFKKQFEENFPLDKLKAMIDK
jgi:hypothetical protein